MGSSGTYSLRDFSLRAEVFVPGGFASDIFNQQELNQRVFETLYHQQELNQKVVNSIQYFCAHFEVWNFCVKF